MLKSHLFDVAADEVRLKTLAHRHVLEHLVSQSTDKFRDEVVKRKTLSSALLKCEIIFYTVRCDREEREKARNKCVGLNLFDELVELGRIYKNGRNCKKVFSRLESV